MLWLQTTREGSGTMNLGGSLTRQVEQDATVSEASPHLVNIGKLVEVCSKITTTTATTGAPDKREQHILKIRIAKTLDQTVCFRFSLESS